MKPFIRKNWLWIWICPTAFSWLLVSIVKPANRSAFWVELAIVCLFSFSCGFALAIKSFPTFKRRFLGGLFFAGSSLYLLSCVAFLGCLPLPQRQLSPAQIDQNRRQQEIRRRAWVARQVLPRDAEADASMLDLSSFYDGLLPGTALETNTPFRFLKPGTHTWDGIKFDVRGVIEPGWRSKAEADSIPVGRKCSELDFLQGAFWGEPSNTVSQFVIHFTNGHNETVPIIFGRDVSDSHFRNNFIPANTVVWEERIITNAPPKPFFGFFIKKWNNPFPDETIETIIFVPEPAYSGVFLIAITAQPITTQKP